MLSLGLEFALQRGDPVPPSDDTVEPTPTGDGPTVIGADGWRAVFPDPPASFDAVANPETVAVTRQGFTATGAPTTVSDVLTVTTRMREPYPDHETLTADQVALSDFVYADDTIAGVTNSSARVYPKPIAMWLNHDLERALSSTHTVRLAVAHGHARMGRPVACVIFTATDESGNTTSQTVSTMSTISYAASGMSVPHFAANLDFSALTQGEIVTVDAVIYPWVGEAFTISVDADTYPSPNLCTLAVFNDRAASYGTNYAYVNAATGDDGAGAVSQTPATAAAAPFATAGAATAAIRAANSADFGRANYSGGVVRLTDDVVHTITDFSGNVEGEIPLVIENAPENAGRAVFQDAAAHILDGIPDSLKFKGLTIRRNGANNTIFLDSNSRSSSPENILVFEDCVFDANGFTNPYSAWIFRTSRVWFIECSGDNCGQSQFSGDIRKGCITIGCAGEGFSGTATHHIAGSRLDQATVRLSGAGSNRIAQLGKFVGFSTLNTSNLTNPMVLTDGNVIGPRGFALIGNVIEGHGSAGANGVIRINGDSDTNPAQNVVMMSNTAVGERLNWLYNDTGNAEKSGYCRWNIFRQRNTKTDVFGQNGTYTGNWAVAFNVAHEGNTAIIGSNQSDGPGTGYWIGEVAGMGDVYGSDADPVIVDFANDKSRDGDGQGGGDYTPGPGYAGSRIKAGYAPHAFDLKGTPIPGNGAALSGALQG